MATTRISYPRSSATSGCANSWASKSSTLDRDWIRIALVLRAVDIPALSAVGQWADSYVIDDFDEIIDLSEVHSTDDANVGYDSSENGFSRIPQDVRGGRLFNFVTQSNGLPLRDEDVWLQL
jgi:hypothetical protein